MSGAFNCKWRERIYTQKYMWNLIENNITWMFQLQQFGEWHFMDNIYNYKFWLERFSIISF